jgi:glycyl-tRNA synthetase
MAKKIVEKNETMEKLISLSKRRGFIFQGSEIYGGLAGTWDYGPLGVALKNNIKKAWWKRFVLDREDMYGMDAAILMRQEVWKASGHVGGFADPLVECMKCKKRFRADHLEDKIKCPECGGKLGEEKQFNMMFKTNVGAAEDASSISYLRPETAQGMFVNFKNIIDTFHPRLPFGMAQIGKAFRNEIAPRDFLFRTREFEQMEIEYFVKPSEWKPVFEDFVKETEDFFTKDVGLPASKVHRLEVADGDRAHYSKRTIDFEFDYPFGRKELSGLAYRTDFDLGAHTKASTVDLSYYDEESKERFTAHCIEPSYGLDRLVLAVLSDAYSEDSLGGETRTFLKLSPSIAPVKVAVFPLLKNKPELIKKAREVYAMIRKEIPETMFDDNGNIGKRYRRQDEIGTPYCVTVDFDSLEKNDVTVRDRDSGKQERVSLSELVSRIRI